MYSKKIEASFWSYIFGSRIFLHPYVQVYQESINMIWKPGNKLAQYVIMDLGLISHDYPPD